MLSQRDLQANLDHGLEVMATTESNDLRISEEHGIASYMQAMMPGFITLRERTARPVELASCQQSDIPSLVLFLQ